MDIEFISSVSVIAPDPPRSRNLYVTALGLPLRQAEGTEYYLSEEVAGSRHFGVWPLSEAAQSCFGTSTWPEDRPVPQMSIEFEVRDEPSVATSAAELEAQGYTLLHPARTEPWGQTVARIQSDEGLVVGISYAPWMHAAGEQNGE
jgi:catechol 2,3-dioxygenase-like lactoylglutathione lyase family enzyme